MIIIVALLFSAKTCLFNGPSKASITNAEQAEYRFKCEEDSHVFTLSLAEMKAQMKAGKTEIGAGGINRQFECPTCGKIKAVEFPPESNEIPVPQP